MNSARQVLGVVDEFPQHLIGVHHRGRRIAQHAFRGLGVAKTAARPAPRAARRRRPCARNGTARPAWRARWCGRCGPRCRRRATARPAPSRRAAIARTGSAVSRRRPAPAATGRAQQGGAEILRQPAILPQVRGQPLIHVAGQQVGRHGEGRRQVGNRHRCAGPRPGIGVRGEQLFQIALHQAVPWQRAGDGEEQLVHQVDAGAAGLDGAPSACRAPVRAGPVGRPPCRWLRRPGWRISPTAPPAGTNSDRYSRSMTDSHSASGSGGVSSARPSDGSRMKRMA